jgi:hypothetical protein
MFTGFASENTPAIKVWNFFNTFASITAPRSVSLPDDCAPIQVFKTGATSTAINVYLPASAPEGKQITIVNATFGFSSQNLSIRSSDVSGSGTQSGLYIVGPGGYLVLTYSKDFISFGTTGGIYFSGWISLNYSSQTAANYGSIAIGDSNSASGIQSVSIGGASNSSSGSNSGAFGGSSNTASGTSSFIGGGQTATASGTYAFVCGGLSNTANAVASAVVGGYWGTTRSVEGRTVFPASANPITLAAGVAQTSILVVGKQTTDATATVLVSNQSVAGSGNQLVLPNNSAYFVRGSVIANVTAGGDTKGWTFEAVIKRGANAGSTALVSAVVPMVTAADAGAAAWTIAVSADTTNGCLQVQVTGAAATTIRWVCKLESTEVAF